MIHLIREVAVTYKGQRRLGPDIREPIDIAKFVRRLAGDDAREQFFAIYLDGRHRAVSYQTVSVGTATASIVHIREVFQPAVHVGAVSLIVAHTHPSGEAAPSMEDKAITRRLARAGELLGIRLLDHVIVGIESYCSIRELEPEHLDGGENAPG